MSLSRALLSRPRLEMDLAAVGLPHVPLLGRYSYREARPALSEHSHAGAFEICYLVKGRQTYRVDGRDYHLRGGDIFLTFPNEQHSTGGAPEEKGVLYWLVLRPARRSPDFLGLPARLGRGLWQAIRRLPRRHFPGNDRMKEYLDAMTTAFHGREDLHAVMLNHLVTGFLLELAACGSVAALNRSCSLDAVLRHIADHLDEPASVPQLAKIARLSTPHFKVRFKEETGVPPAEYQLRARIKEARRRLAVGKQTVTEIAFDLGFSSSQYFATVYKRFTGQNPSARRR